MLKSVTSLTLSLLLAAPALAAEAPQEAPPPNAAADPNADSVIVTATRAPTPIDQVASSVTVLDKAAIDRAQDIGVTELLLRTPGVSIARNGGYGTSTSLRIRGAESEQTVVVIDGVKLNDPSSTGGGYNFANLLVGDSSRIEVLRGPQSILWGSQAIGGVVNVVTALPQEELEGSFDIEAGSRQTVNARAAVGGKTGPVTWRLGGTSFSTDGISALSPAFGGKEKDGYTNRTLTGRVEIALTDNISADVRGYYGRGKTDIDGFDPITFANADTPEYSLNREFVGYAGLNVALLDGRFRNRIGYGYTDTDRDNYNPAQQRALTFDAAGKNERFEYQGSFAITDTWTALFGAENERSRFTSVSPSASLAVPIPDPARGKAEITSFYGQLSGQIISGLTVNGGIRHEDHSRFGGKTLFAGGAAWALPTGTVLRASYGEAFKAPSLYQLFSEYGNTALNPERAHGWEAGAEQHLFDDLLTIGATYYERTTTDQIIYNSCSTGTTQPLCYMPGSGLFRFGYYNNVSRAEARGIEAQGSFKLSDRLIIDGNYSWAVAEDRSPGSRNFGKWLARRPRETANGSISYSFPFGFTAGAAIRWSGKSYENATNTTKLDDYTLVDLRAEMAVSKSFTLFARAENLFDEHYMTAYRYGSLGRSIYAGIRGRF